MRYGTVARRLAKLRRGLQWGMVEDHHVIPRQFRYHPVILESGLDLDSSRNIVMMPTLYGREKLRLRHDRLVHQGGHTKYNKYVEMILDSIKRPDQFVEFHDFLTRNCRDNRDNIPWQ